MLTSAQYAKRQASVLEAAVCLRTAMPNIERHFAPDVLEAAEFQHPSGLGLHDLMEHGARWNGYSPSRRDIHALYDQCFGTAGQPGVLASAGFSTLDVSGILSNVANKYLMTGFLGVDSAWKAVASVRSVKDFKAAPTFALTGGLELELVGNDGECKYANLGEASYSGQADQYAKVVRISRKSFLNDDINAFRQIPQQLGAGAARAVNRVFWTSFLANVGTLFTSGNANLLTGAGSALSASGLAQAIALLQNQTDPSGEPLAFPARTLLVPPALSVTGYQLAHAALVGTNTAGAKTRDGNGEVEALLRVVSTPYLSNAAYQGSSSTAWFVLVDPDSGLGSMQMLFLDGQQAPVIEGSPDFGSTLGFKFRATHAFGVTPLEYRAGVRSNGQ